MQNGLLGTPLLTCSTKGLLTSMLRQLGPRLTALHSLLGALPLLLTPKPWQLGPRLTALNGLLGTPPLTSSAKNESTSRSRLPGTRPALTSMLGTLALTGCSKEQLTSMIRLLGTLTKALPGATIIAVWPSSVAQCLASKLPS